MKTNPFKLMNCRGFSHFTVADSLLDTDISEMSYNRRHAISSALYDVFNTCDPKAYITLLEKMRDVHLEEPETP